MGKGSFKFQVIAPVFVASALVTGLSAGGLAAVNYSMQKDAAAAQAQSQINNVRNSLEGTASLMEQQTSYAMNALIDVAKRSGESSAGHEVEIVPGVSAPDIKFGDKGQALNFELVDGIKNVVGSTATLFSRTDHGWVRITTNVKKPNGDRAIGTVLDPKGPAVESLERGAKYSGVVDILGKPYFTDYRPLGDANGKPLGAYYVGYPLSLESLGKSLSEATLLKHGFFAIVDKSGAPVFTSKRQSLEGARAFLRGARDGWVVERNVVQGWNYEVVAAFPESDLRDDAEAAALRLAAGGLAISLAMSILIGLLLDRKVIKPLGGDPSSVSAAMIEMANGNLDAQLPSAQEGTLLGSLGVMQRKLTCIASAIRKSSAAFSESRRGFEEATEALRVAPEGSSKRELESGLAASAKKLVKQGEELARAADKLKV